MFFRYCAKCRNEIAPNAGIVKFNSTVCSTFRDHFNGLTLYVSGQSIVLDASISFPNIRVAVIKLAYINISRALNFLEVVMIYLERNNIIMPIRDIKI